VAFVWQPISKKKKLCWPAKNGNGKTACTSETGLGTRNQLARLSRPTIHHIPDSPHSSHNNCNNNMDNNPREESPTPRILHWACMISLTRWPGGQTLSHIQFSFRQFERLSDGQHCCTWDHAGKLQTMVADDLWGIQNVPALFDTCCAESIQLTREAFSHFAFCLQQCVIHDSQCFLHVLLLMTDACCGQRRLFHASCFLKN
jgi:hypothetical protein